MEKLLKQIGFTHKEIQCYLALLEYGQQPASTIARKLKMPKATVLFTLNGLTDQGYVQRIKKGKTQYYFADPEQLAKAKRTKAKHEDQILEQLIPLLKESRNPLTAPPKVSFFEGIRACRDAYGDMLNSKTDILEFATPDDLYEKFGTQWCEAYIAKRVRNKIMAKDIRNDTPMSRRQNAIDKKQLRQTKFITEKKGKMYSSISLYDDKLLMLNLGSDAFGILIQNAAIVETMKTIHRLVWK